MTNKPVTIKENKNFRIVHLWNDYFVDGKNAFGRWVTIRRIEESEIEEVWAKASGK